MAWLITLLTRLFQWDAQPDFTMPTEPLPEAPKQPVATPSPTVPESDAERLYQAAKASLGRHLTLNPSVPNEVGCAEAISAILKQVGVSVPQAGIAGTLALYEWLPLNGFTQVEDWARGDIIISPTGKGNGSVRGHTGIMGDAGILSNDSSTGKFMELWTLDAWKDWYGRKGGLPVVFYRWG